MEELNLFKQYLEQDEKCVLTIKKYVRDVGNFLSFLGERELNKSAVLDYKQLLVGSYATASVNSIISSLNAFFNFLGRDECRVRMVKQQRSAFVSEERELNRQEYERLVKAAESKPRLCLLMQTICATGIRVSEHPFITVEAAKNGVAQVRMKGKCRPVFLPRKLCRALLKYAKTQGIVSGSIFVTASGRPLDRSNIWAEMKKLCSAAGVNRAKVFPHNLRHLFARIYYGLEKDIVRLADILGHSSINTTRIYTMESGSTHRRQIEKLKLLLIT